MDRRQQICSELLRVDKVDPSKDQVIAKHSLMAANPFRFMRGAASLFYADIKSGLLTLPTPLEIPSLQTCIMGDCHISNFGFFSEEGSHGDSIIFAPNDFDDACIGNACWDLLRYLLSLHLTVDYCQKIHSGELESEENLVVEDLIVAMEHHLQDAQQGFLNEYVDTCQELISNPKARRKVVSKFPKDHILRRHAQKARKRAAGGKHFSSKSALAKLITGYEVKPAFDFSSSKIKMLNSQLKAEIIQVFRPYVDDEILDVAERMGAGTGSINMQRYYLLVGPVDYVGEQDLGLCHIVEVKQQRVAAPVQHFEDFNPVNQLTPAHLTLVCQQRMQRRPDLVLDEIIWSENHWLVRSRHHAKVGIKPEHIGLANKPENVGLVTYAKTSGRALALAHCRGDRRSTRFEQKVVDLLPRYFKELGDRARDYAVQTHEDCQILKELIELDRN